MPGPYYVAQGRNPLSGRAKIPEGARFAAAALVFHLSL